MNKKINLLPKPNLNLMVILALFLVVAISPYFDIIISKFFYNRGFFNMEDNLFINLMSKGIPEFLVALSIIIFVIWVVGFINGQKWLWGINTRVMAFTTGSMLLGPILIVNGIFKTFWGRARPKDILEFGGDKIFTPPLVISNQCSWDCSFMSGHTAVGMWLLCLALLAPHKYRYSLIVLALLFGSLMGAIRIVQGSHFFSDVFFSGVVTVSIILWMHYKLFKNDYRK